MSGIDYHKLEDALARTALVNASVVPKLKPLVELSTWANTNAKNIITKVIRGKPIFKEESDTLTEDVLLESAIENSVNELIHHDYVFRLGQWNRQLNVAVESGNMELIDKVLSAKPMLGTTMQYIHVTDALDDLLAIYEDAISPDSQIVKNPFVEFRNIIGDFGPGSFHIIAGEPGSLKSGLVEQAELTIADVFTCGVMSLEMITPAKLARYAQHIYGDCVSWRAIQSGTADLAFLKQARDILKEKRLLIDDKPKNIIQLLNSMELMMHNDNPSIFSVDFIQELDGINGEEEYETVKRIVKGLYNFAKDHRKPVIALSQINREATKDIFDRNGKKVDRNPKMGDLLGGSAIEQLAHSVTFLQRIEGNADARRIYIVKNRNGEAPHDFPDVAVDGQRMNVLWTESDFYKQHRVSLGK